MFKTLVTYFFVFFLILVGITTTNTHASLADDNNTIMQKTDGLTPEDCATYGNGPKNEEYKQYCGDYKIEDFVILGIKLTKIMLGLVGTLAFVAFVYGGLMWLISAGRKEYIDKGKSAMLNAVIGLIIVFSSYLIIQFTLKTLGYIDENGKINNNFGSGEWNEVK